MLALLDMNSKLTTLIAWVPGKLNLADACTKQNSPLADALQMMMHTIKLPIDFPDLEYRDSYQFFG